jgi:hypothetical protein
VWGEVPPRMTRNAPSPWLNQEQINLNRMGNRVASTITFKRLKHCFIPHYWVFAGYPDMSYPTRKTINIPMIVNVQPIDNIKVKKKSRNPLKRKKKSKK